MDQTELLALYDEDQRINIHWPGERREVSEQVIRHISRSGVHSFIIYSDLKAENADAVIRQEQDLFVAMGHHLEWKVFEHDAPADLRQRLEQAGFDMSVPPDAVMVLDAEQAPAALRENQSTAIRQITTPEQVGDILAVQREVWGSEFERLTREMAETLRDRPDQLSVYAAYVDNQPVSSAWARYTPNSQFASLWGGTTLPDYRGQGHYSALLAARLQDAVQHGRRFLTVDASPMSRPILEKHGFQVITWAWECHWNSEVDQ